MGKKKKKVTGINVLCHDDAFNSSTMCNIKILSTNLRKDISYTEINLPCNYPQHSLLIYFDYKTLYF